MKRYVPRAAFLFVDEFGEASMTADTVIVEEAAPQFSGLYDATGAKLFRRTDKLRVGFVVKGSR